jgi:hypothetical protein
MAAAITAAASARIAPPPGDEPDYNAYELNRAELNTVGDDPGARPANVGLICVWAIHASEVEVGRRCRVTPAPAFQAELESSVARMEDYARRHSPARAAQMAAYRQSEIVGDTRLCDADTVDTYNEFSHLDPARLRRDVDELLARSPAVEWGDTCV